MQSLIQDFISSLTNVPVLLQRCTKDRMRSFAADVDSMALTALNELDEFPVKKSIRRPDDTRHRPRGRPPARRSDPVKVDIRMLIDISSTQSSEASTVRDRISTDAAEYVEIDDIVGALIGRLPVAFRMRCGSSTKVMIVVGFDMIRRMFLVVDPAVDASTLSNVPFATMYETCDDCWIDGEIVK